jgi:membrane complex biogenesis BtpA family protein
MTLPSLIGMVHLLPLPGSPRFAGKFDQILERAVADALVLEEAGFTGLMVENFGDAPFYPHDVPPVTVAGIAAAVNAVRAAVSLPVGVNVLRNDGVAALGIAAVTEAAYIRVNVLTGTMFTDQGSIEGKAAVVARERLRLCPDTLILADVLVKHASPPPGVSIEQAGLDTWERGGADALIFSGTGTGVEPDLDQAARLRRAVPDAHILVGSGATPANLTLLARAADGVIVGTYLKAGGQPSGTVDASRASAMVEAAARLGWV